MQPNPPTTSDDIRVKLKLKSLETKNKFNQIHSKSIKFLNDRGVNLSKIRNHSSRLLGAGMVSGMLLLTQPNSLNYLPRTALEMEKFLPKPDPTPMPPMGSFGSLMSGLRQTLPETVRPLARTEEKALEKLLSENLKVPVRATLEGEHLNTTYGYIGAEQHLRRYPGDTISQHGSLEDQKEGIAPGLGAWGYFAPSQEKLTPDLVETEKWYAVAQTLYLPDWNTRTRYLRDWYKYRKVLIVNTDNGKAVVAAIADSGPAAWTGKQFGGSPEVMDHLGGPRYKKGAVLFFFVDDPNNEIKLGPVEYNNN